MKLLACFLSFWFILAGVINAAEDNPSTSLRMVSLSNHRSLEEGFINPPQSAGIRCFWWWLNGNVTKEAITRDLEEMKAKGFSGALIFDAGGAEQRGNKQVPAGPTFATPQWRELFKHAVQEADRLGLELSLNILSGWNLGGPNVTPDMAAKMLTWSEIQIEGPVSLVRELPEPSKKAGFYKDIAVLAFPLKQAYDSQRNQPTIKANSCQSQYPEKNAIDGNENTFWVSSGTEPGQGPSSDKPEWLELSFEEPVTISGIGVMGRTGYGPRRCRFQVTDKDNKFETIHTFEIEDGKTYQGVFKSVSGKIFRLLIEGAYDVRFPETARNVQVTEFYLTNAESNKLSDRIRGKPIRDLQAKAASHEIGMSAPDCRFLLEDIPAVSGEEDTGVKDILNITDKMTPEGKLTWQVPSGKWVILRFGYTPSGANVSTYSADWKGLVIDYMDSSALRAYWNEVVQPLLSDIGPLAGKRLKYLATDSWECGGANWTSQFPSEFKKRRGYDPIPYLPVIAGKIVESRDVSNRFLADFRKTIGDYVAENHYQVFAELAHQSNLGIHPESGGPHAGPFDAIKCLGRNDIAMGEFWVPSPHRPRPAERFFVKQSSSAAHIYGKKLVGAEAFTSIGPHWDDVLWASQKPSFDHEACSGLNLAFVHTFTCSPRQMGIPGQEYFAGTHFNPNVTWWEYAGAFVTYLNRCQYLLQQGKFVADVLYYYGDHVPNIMQLKEADPAKVLPGFDYDVTDEEILLKLKAENNCIIVPGGISYRALVLPDHKILSLAALKKVHELIQDGATVIGPKPERTVSLVGYPESEKEFKTLADEIWGQSSGPTGQKELGKGRIIWGKTAREVLLNDGVQPDFEIRNHQEDSTFDYIHYTIDEADVYLVCNQKEREEDVICIFRTSKKQPELWNPVTSEIYNDKAFKQSNGRTEVPFRFPPYGSLFVVFRKPISETTQGQATTNSPDYKALQQIQGPWDVYFDPNWGGPGKVRFDGLVSWTERPEEGVRSYSGKGIYTTTFSLTQPKMVGRQYVLDLGEVLDTGIARVRLNGKDSGVAWSKPFRVDVTNIVQNGENTLTVEVINSWRNRLVADRDLPQDKRYTQTNVRVLPTWRLNKSGLLGPVQILVAQQQE
jgi:hypothetical protein